MTRIFLVAASAMLCACTPDAAQIEAKDAWLRTGGHGSAAYLTLVNRGGADRLVAIEAPVPASLHDSKMDNGVMRMRPMSDGLEIPAGGTVTLAPMGKHVMLEGAVPDQVPLTLRFDRHPAINVTATVRR